MIWLFILFLGGLGVYLIVTLWIAAHQVDESPMADMYICDIHGPMPKSNTVTLFGGDEVDHVLPDGKTLRGPIRMCPICFEDRIKTAKKNLT